MTYDQTTQSLMGERLRHMVIGSLGSWTCSWTSHNRHSTFDKLWIPFIRFTAPITAGNPAVWRLPGGHRPPAQFRIFRVKDEMGIASMSFQTKSCAESFPSYTLTSKRWCVIV